MVSARATPKGQKMIKRHSHPAATAWSDGVLESWFGFRLIITPLLQFLTQQIFVRNQPDDRVLRRVANHAERIAAALHRLDRFAVEAPQQDHALIGRA